jgi:hypothetical protein
MRFPGQRMLILRVSLTESAYQIVKTHPKESHHALCFRAYGKRRRQSCSTILQR